MREYRVTTHPKKGKGTGECFYLGTSPCKAWDAYRKRATLEMLKGEKITTIWTREGLTWELMVRSDPA